MADLASLTPQQYLNRFHINFYLQDILNLLVAKKQAGADGPRGAVEFIGKYFETVLRSEHVINRTFTYINATPLNRRAFVSLLRSTLSGVGDHGSIALTSYDFYDLILRLCADFPYNIVEDAAAFAEMAEPRRHHLLGETTPLGAETFDAGRINPQGASEDDIDVGVKRSKLLLMQSLQRFVEVHLVYSEIIAALKNRFWSVRPDIDGECRSRIITRSLVSAEFEKLRSGSVDIAVPSERALERLLFGSQSLNQRLWDGEEVVAASSASTVAFAEVIHCMADQFELVPEPYPEEVLGDLGDILQDVAAPDDCDLPASGTDRRRNFKGIASSADKRRRDKKSKSRA